MKITEIISPRGCANGACPSILLTDSGVVLVQGTKLAQGTSEAEEARAFLAIPSHEDVVCIPQRVFEELVSRYCRQPGATPVLRA